MICVPPRLYDWEFCLETPIAHRRSEPKAGVMFFSGVGFSDEAVNCQFVHHEKTCVFFFFWRFGSFRKWQPWIWIASRWSTGGEEFAQFALMGSMPFSLRKSAGMGTSRGVRGRSSLARE